MEQEKNKSWGQEADELGNEMEEYAKNYKCKKCSEFYCSHMLKAMASKFKKRSDEHIGKLIETAFA